MNPTLPTAIKVERVEVSRVEFSLRQTAFVPREGLRRRPWQKDETEEDSYWVLCRFCVGSRLIPLALSVPL